MEGIRPLTRTRVDIVEEGDKSNKRIRDLFGRRRRREASDYAERDRVHAGPMSSGFDLGQGGCFHGAEFGLLDKEE